MNYKIEAINILLDEKCILERYFSLIPFKGELLKKFNEENIQTKEDAISCDEVLFKVLKDEYLVNIFKRFLNMYEVNKSKLKEIDKLNLSIEEKNSYLELYLLPGVKATRARLYYLSNLKTLKDVAAKSPEDIINLTKMTIINNNLDCKEPLLKEANTHIVVAKLISEYLL